MESTEKKIEDIRQMAKRMRLKALDMALKSGKKGSHLGGAFSCMEILACLYGEVMNIHANNPTAADRDRFIASKAHCVLAYYTALYEKGFISEEELETFQENGTYFGAHPYKSARHGIEYTGGSLGMGLSLGVGMALDAKMKKRENHVYILIGDGEIQEGSNWEAIMSAAQFQLNHLTLIVDKNKLQYYGQTSQVMNIDPLTDKLKAFGWEADMVDGHDIPQLLNVLKKETKKPHAVIADTIKGKGVSFMENEREWHHSVLTKEQYETATEEVRNKPIC